MGDSSSKDDDFVRAFGPLVEAIAHRAKRQMGLTCEFDDLVAFGYTGLFEARARFEASRGTSFRAYADKRIYGAIVDGVRRMAYLPRRAHARLKAAETLNAATEASAETETRQKSLKGATPTAVPEVRALAAAHHLSLILGQMATAYAVTAAKGEAAQHIDDDDDPEALLLRKQRSAHLTAALESLSERERFLIRGHYMEGRSLDDLAHEVGLSKSWASRMHAKALLRLRQALRKG